VSVCVRVCMCIFTHTIHTHTHTHTHTCRGGRRSDEGLLVRREPPKAPTAWYPEVAAASTANSSKSTLSSIGEEKNLPPLRNPVLFLCNMCFYTHTHTHTHTLCAYTYERARTCTHVLCIQHLCAIVSFSRSLTHSLSLSLYTSILAPSFPL
jgi:hypothetical protein